MTVRTVINICEHQGCALDFFTNNELREDAEARISEDAFMYQRNRARPPQSRPLPTCEQDSRSSSSSSSTITNKCNRSTSNSSPPTTAGASAVETSTERNCHHSCDVEPPPIWDGFHVSLVREVVFQTLARLAWDALLQSSGKHATPRGALIAQVQPPISAAGEEAMGTDSAAGSDRHAAGMCEARRLLLFNEQYVVKPPNSSIEFGWHTVSHAKDKSWCHFSLYLMGIVRISSHTISRNIEKNASQPASADYCLFDGVVVLNAPICGLGFSPLTLNVGEIAFTPVAKSLDCAIKFDSDVLYIHQLCLFSQRRTCESHRSRSPRAVSDLVSSWHVLLTGSVVPGATAACATVLSRVENLSQGSSSKWIVVLVAEPCSSTPFSSSADAAWVVTRTV